MATRVRPAVSADAPELARAYVASWRWAYSGLLPKRYLDALSTERHTRYWAALMEHEKLASIWMAYDEDGCCGMASAGPARSKSAAVGEVYTLYVIERAIGRGVGRLLLAYAVAQLKATQHTSAILWMLEANDRARRFYERQGWRPDGARESEEIGGVELNVVRYRRAL